ncbi:kinase-like domain-containing protein [Cokeromyces recurvatus]|uniref:kinase-like domain-containing protein n=1 Tax=Cokeromyces recurvatus TaxID=90255 RepID=UPI00222046F3|nr:kinase-like domain-containing protein [Cokeromyces recurvatus]KAI7903878.1 kinase-like domain-containing protein [Cokeromyces recurvatus]
MVFIFKKSLETKKKISNDTEEKKEEEKITNNQDRFLNGVGPYKFIKPLGSGKFSTVMLAKHLETQQEVAIKIIDKLSHDYRVMARLVREIAIMKVLQHDSIVRLYETFESCDSLYLIMEYVPGWNLDEYLQGKKNNCLNEDEARHIFSQLVTAVDYCHRNWIVHRDLKTPNVLITLDKNVKLADFGLGNQYGLQRLRTICGSMLYYSPEIITGQKYYGPEVDCWCLGITLFRMTAGFEPFSHAHTVGELKKDICKCNFLMPNTLSLELQATIRKCLQADRRKRMTIRQALKDDPWLTNLNQLPCPLSTSSETVFENEACNNSLSEKSTRQQFRKDFIRHDSTNTNIRKTIIYHPINPATYYTTKSFTNLTPGEGGYHHQNVELLRSDLLQSICTRTHRLGIRSRKRWKSLFLSSLKRHSITDLVQRITKDQVYYFQLNSSLQQIIDASHPPSLSSSPTSYSSSDEIPTVNIEQQENREIMALICETCQLMGITYFQDSLLSLQCVLTLRNTPKILPIVRASSSYSRKQSQSSASLGDDFFTTKRLSLPLLSHLTSSMTTSFFGRSKPRHSVDQAQRQQQIIHNNRKGKQGIAVFKIEVECHKRRADRIVLRFSKLQGSNTVFKMASGWIASVMTLDSK